MLKKFLKLLFDRAWETNVITNEKGEVIFVGTLRQLRRRFQIQYGLARTEDVLRMLEEKGYTLRPLSQNHGDVYNVNMDKLKEKLKEIPKDPGVYQFLNKDGEIIYVGKAKNLRSRVSQYFGGKDERPQLPYLMQEAADIQYTVVNNEIESLYLENTLIKQHLPKYNIQLRDDKNYAFITIDYSTEIPRIGYARKIDPSVQRSALSAQNETTQRSTLNARRSKYFGPFTAAYKIRNTLNLVRRIFPYCSADKVSSRPCFYYYLHRCPGVCIGKISLDEYRQQLNRISDFLSGDTAKITRELKAEMKLASSKQLFEKAARLRDQLQALELLEEKQAVILPRLVSWDVVSLSADQGYACVNLFKVRGGKLFDKENFVYEYSADVRIDYGSADANTPELIQNFLEQYYLDASEAPKEIFIEQDIEDPGAVRQLIEDRFSRKTKLAVPKRGKAKELAALGKTNAAEYLKNWLLDKAGHLDKINEALEQLRDALQLHKLPERIECYDISNIQGTNAVSSMVVFEKGLPKKSEYRKFKIKSRIVSAEGLPKADDFAMMKETLSRRLARLPGGTAQPSWPKPDLIVIDGGKGQLNAALEVLGANPSALRAIPIIGLAKRIEEIFVPGNSEPITLSHDEPALQMLQRLRDEAHRFGITYHRDLRSRQAVKSALDDIPGIGPKTKKLLKQKFGTIKNIRKASMEELAAVVGQRIAESIKLSL